DELAPLLRLEEHVPAVEELERVGEVDAPVRRERHLPAERHHAAPVLAVERLRVPDAVALDQGQPDLAGLPELDLGAGEGPLLAAAREREPDVLVAMLEHGHHDRVVLSPEVKEEVLAGRLNGRDRDLRGVDDDVVREEVGEYDEPAQGLDAKP